MRIHYDRKTKDIPRLKVGDLVMLNGKHLKTRRPCQKLDQKMQGPFKIEKVISYIAVKVILPQRWGGPKTFHVSLLEPFPRSRKGLREPVNPDVVMRDVEDLDVEEGIWEIEEVVGSSIDAQGKVK